MSFDRMNRFVDEHTVLMREFLRNISTLSDEEQHELELEKTRWEKTASSTASAPISSFVLTPQHTPNSSSASVLPNNELNFDLEPIDLGKQLSILHSLLTSILSTLDEVLYFILIIIIINYSLIHSLFIIIPFYLFSSVSFIGYYLFYLHLDSSTTVD